jgi:hypothetical protein
MFNVSLVDADLAGREPLAILAELAVKEANDSAHDETGSAPRDVDGRCDEYRVMFTAYRALCESHGLRAIGSYELTWVLYCLGALESAVGWFYLEDFLAPYAWPDHGVALMLSIPLSSFEEDSAEDLLAMALHEEDRDAAFQNQGWTVVRIDPRSRRLDEQLEHVAALVAAQDPESAS